MSTPKYLKKKGDPDTAYWAYSEILAARPDMEPFDPTPVQQELPIEVVPATELAPAETEPAFHVRRVGRKYGVIGPDGDVVGDPCDKEAAEELAAQMNSQG